MTGWKFMLWVVLATVMFNMAGAIHTEGIGFWAWQRMVKSLLQIGALYLFAWGTREWWR